MGQSRLDQWETSLEQWRMDQQTWQTTAAQLKSEFIQQDLAPLNLDFTGELVVNVMILATYTCVRHVHFAFVLTIYSYLFLHRNHTSSTIDNIHYLG